MNTTASECYESKGGCGHMVYPTSVKPPRRRREKRTESNHSCDAQDCLRHKDSGIAEGGASHFSRTGGSQLHHNIYISSEPLHLRCRSNFMNYIVSRDVA